MTQRAKPEHPRYSKQVAQHVAESNKRGIGVEGGPAFGSQGPERLRHNRGRAKRIRAAGGGRKNFLRPIKGGKAWSLRERAKQIRG